MESKEGVAGLMESKGSDVDTKILWIQFNSVNDLKALFIPKLENISFVLVNTRLTITLSNPSFRDFFNSWVTIFIEKIDAHDSSEVLIEKYNHEIKALVLLGQREKKMTMNAAKGLFAELLVLKKYLEDPTFPKSDIIEGWHRPAPANHDFEYAECSLEVKATSRDSTTIKITSEHQLMAAGNKPLHLHIYRIDNVNKSSEDSLGDMFITIKELLDTGLKNVFEMKCAEDSFCSYLGPKLMPLDYKFIIIEGFIYDVNQEIFPRIRKNKLDNGLSKISYNIDISVIEKFKIK